MSGAEASWVAGLRSAVAWTLQRLTALAPESADLRAMGRSPRRDVLAGVTVGIVALPLALAFGITSGLGASAGLVTAVVAGALAALFGGSAVQVSGPTGAMTVVLVPIVATYGVRGVLVVGLMAGVILVVMAFAGLGRYVRYIPLPVIEGFTLGIAVIIALQQIPAALGVRAEGEQVLAVGWRAVRAWSAAPSAAAVAVTVAVAGTMLALKRLRPSIPVALIAVIAATVGTARLDLPLATIGRLPSTIPSPSLPAMSVLDLRVLAAPAVAVAALAALESLLSATVADALTVSTRHNPDRELFGQGIANLASPLFGGIPATAAIARTAVNIRSGAQSRLAALVHAAVLLLVVLALQPYVARIPVAALAGVLIATAFRMVEVPALRAMVRSGRSDALVLVVTFVATVVLDLATAVILGILAAGGLALRQVARAAAVTETTIESSLEEDSLDRGVPAVGRDDDPEECHTAAERGLLDEHIVAYRFEGTLFFGGAHTALVDLADVDNVRVVVLRLSHLTTLDATAAHVLAETIRTIEARGTTVLLSGLRPRHQAPLAATGILAELERHRHVFARTPAAIGHARRHVARDGHHAASGDAASPGGVPGPPGPPPG